MPFDLLATVTKMNAPPQATLSYVPFSRKGKHKDDAKPRLCITVPTSVVTSKAKSFVLMIGSGEHAGKLRLVGLVTKEQQQHLSDGIKPTELAHALRFNFGYVPRLNDEIFDGERRSIIKINDDTYEIEVGKLFDQLPEPARLRRSA